MQSLLCKIFSREIHLPSPAKLWQIPATQEFPRLPCFHASELLTPDRPNFNLALDPKCDWALRHLEQFPVEISRADYATLMRVPGIGTKSALRILKARRLGPLSFSSIRKMGVVLKRAQYFITCNGKMHVPIRLDEDFITRQLTATDAKNNYMIAGSIEIYEQLSLF